MLNDELSAYLLFSWDIFFILFHVFWLKLVVVFRSLVATILTISHIPLYKKKKNKIKYFRCNRTYKNRILLRVARIRAATNTQYLFIYLSFSRLFQFCSGTTMCMKNEEREKKVAESLSSSLGGVDCCRWFFFRFLFYFILAWYFSHLYCVHTFLCVWKPVCAN